MHFTNVKSMFLQNFVEFAVIFANTVNTAVILTESRFTHIFLSVTD